jgi:hypothetical protein
MVSEKNSVLKVMLTVKNSDENPSIIDSQKNSIALKYNPPK